MKKLITSHCRDPYVIRHNNKYYRCFSFGASSIGVAYADTIDALRDAEPITVYTAPAGTAYSKELWAPELHIIDGKCYIYVACDDGENRNHRMYVLENNSDDPAAPYTMHSQITDPTDKWAIDGTVMPLGGKMYFIWSGWEGDVNVCQNLYIAEMADPFTLCGERHLLSVPTFEWEKRGASDTLPLINEGPFAFKHNGKQYLTYSASGSWCEHYCIALLELTGDNPLKQNSWHKYPAPILCTNEQVKGAGHCSLLMDEDGTHVFFHAWDKEETNICWNTVALWHGHLAEENGRLIIL